MASWLELVTAPTGELISVEEAQRQVRRFDGDESDVLRALSKAAEQHLEDVTGRQLRTATYRLHLDAFGCAIEIPRPPLVAVSAITYRDTAGVTQTLAADQYVVSAETGPRAPRSWIRPAYQAIWPPTYGVPDAVIVQFQAGYGDAAAVPASLRHAAKLLIAGWYVNPGAIVTGTIASELPRGVRSLIAPYISRDTLKDCRRESWPV